MSLMPVGENCDTQASGLSDGTVTNGNLLLEAYGGNGALDLDDGFNFPLTHDAQDVLDSSWPCIGWLGPVHMAAKRGHNKILRLLMDKHPDCNEKDSDGTTPLMLAIAGGYEDVTDTLLRHGARIAEVNNQQRSALHWAVLHRRDAILRILLRYCTDDPKVVNGYDNNGRTPLHMAIDMEFEAGVELLLVSGADVNCKARKI
jgi:hypothetical protein